MSLVIEYRRFWCRRDTTANWESENPILHAGEWGIEEDANSSPPVPPRAKLGDGYTRWLELAYYDPAFFAVAAGTDTITADFEHVPLLVDGLTLYLRAGGANTGPATFNPSGLGALPLTKFGGEALAGGDIFGAGHELLVRYVEATPGWELLNPASSASGSGDVVGPAAAVNNRIAVFDGVTGKLIKDSGSLVADLLPASYLDVDGTLAANSDAKIASQKAVKTYIDTLVTGLLDFKGDLNASANPNYPSALKGDAYAISAAGKVGGASGKSVDIGDMLVAKADNAGGTEASVGTSWFVMEHNLVGVLLAANNLSDLANVATAVANLGFATNGSPGTYASDPSLQLRLVINALGQITNQTEQAILAPQTGIAVAQAAHGFSVGHAVQLTGSSWAVADADAGSTVADAIVSAVADVNNFTALLVGRLTLTTGEWDARTGDTGGLTAGEYYWTSGTAGGLTKTQPTSGIAQCIGVATSTTTMLVNVGEAIEVATLDATLAALAGQNWALNSLAIGTGTDTVVQVTFAANTFVGRGSTGNLVAKTISDDALAFVAAANNAAMRIALGLPDGTYTPTLFNTTNVAASTAYVCSYARVGNVVHVVGRVDIDPTAGSVATLLGMSLPIASNLAVAADLGGVAAVLGIASVAVGIIADTTNDRASFSWIHSADTANRGYPFSFSYRVT